MKDETKEKNLVDMTSQLEDFEDVNARIESLEHAESNMLENLQRSINEHHKLLNLSKTGNLDSMTVQESKQRLNFEFGKAWNPWLV